MCGRYRLSRRKQLIAEYFETDNEVDWEPRYNIAPSQPVGIIRTTPNSLLADVHDRMPVILRRENYDLWLDPGFKDVKALAGVLSPFDATQMRSFPVSTRINAVTNDDPDCVVPAHSSLPAQSSLFG
jgi:putative SOS response-associated peptidase YedK